MVLLIEKSDRADGMGAHGTEVLAYTLLGVPTSE